MVCADDDAHAPGVPDDIHLLHCGSPWLALLHSIYTALLVGGDHRPLSMENAHELITRLSWSGWVQHLTEGTLPDGQFGVSDVKLIISTLERDELQEYLTSGAGDQGHIVASITKLAAARFTSPLNL